MRPVHFLAALAGVACALVIGLTTGVGGIGGVATACAQEPPPIPFPTFGPIDPSCNGVPDTDNDGVFDYQDNCQGYYNPNQVDTDSDSGEPPYQPVNAYPRDPSTGGDTCDTDDDGDGVADSSDNCPKVSNKEQTDADSDGKGNVCDPQPFPADGPTATAAAPSTPSSGATTGSATAPKLRIVGLSSRQHLAELQAGLAVPVRCTAACSVTGSLLLGKLRAGTGKASLDDAGMTFVFVKLSKAAKRSVARRRARATLRLTATDAKGAHRSAVTRRLTLSR